MISPFGVDHGTFSKAFRKIAPKLARARTLIQDAHPNGRLQPMEGRLRENYAQWRGSAGRTGEKQMFGKPGPSSIASAREAKQGATAMVTAAGNRTKRAGRYLP